MIKNLLTLILVIYTSNLMAEFEAITGNDNYIWFVDLKKIAQGAKTRSFTLINYIIEENTSDKISSIEYLEIDCNNKKLRSHGSEGFKQITKENEKNLQYLLFMADIKEKNPAPHKMTFAGARIIFDWIDFSFDKKNTTNSLATQVCSPEIKTIKKVDKVITNWIYGAHSIPGKTNSVNYFFDKDSMEIFGDIRIADILYDFVNPQSTIDAGSTYLSSVLVGYQFDCLRKKGRMGRVKNYTYNNTRGLQAELPELAEITDAGIYTSWYDFTSKSVKEQLSNKICALKGPYQ